MRALRRSADGLTGVRDEYETLFTDRAGPRRRSRRTFHVTDAGVTRLALLEMCNGVAHWYRPEAGWASRTSSAASWNWRRGWSARTGREPWTGPVAEARILDIEPRVRVPA